MDFENIQQAIRRIIQDQPFTLDGTGMSGSQVLIFPELVLKISAPNPLTDGMLQVMRYLDHSENHVLYRVTPYFVGDELVARGVEMEAYSVEDRGEGVCFHVFVYNVQPGIDVDYATGESQRS